jgi:hypothetical protein
MTYKIGPYEFKTIENSDRVFWANNAFWENWPKLAQARFVYADHSNASASNLGHIDIRVYPVDVQEFLV